mgnify:FL=1
MSTAPIQRAKEAEREWHRKKTMANYYYAAGNAMADAIEALEEPRLTEEEREHVEWHRIMYPSGSRMRAIIDRLAPMPEPAHRKCPHCGNDGAVFSRVIGDRPYMTIRCLGCEAEGPPRQDIGESWRLWDRRA